MSLSDMAFKWAPHKNRVGQTGCALDLINAANPLPKLWQKSEGIAWISTVDL